MLQRVAYWSVSLLLVLVAVVWGEWPDGEMHVVGCDVGQGDATLVSRGFGQVLIDGGPPNGRVLTCLGKYMPFWDRKIEMVVMTHPQVDHFGGLVEVFKRYEVEVFLAGDDLNMIDDYVEMVSVIEDREVEVVVAREGVDLALEGMKWRVLWPVGEEGVDVWEKWRGLGDDHQTEWSADNSVLVEKFGDYVAPGDLNENSVVMLLEYGKFRGVFAGDIGFKEEERMVDMGLVSDVDLLKVAHHGSKTSSSSEFLELVDAEVAMVSVGRKNTFGHPNVGVLDRLMEGGARVLRTDRQGSVEVVSDGEGSVLVLAD